jgi:hypothetical protein
VCWQSRRRRARYDRWLALSDVWAISFREFLGLVKVRRVRCTPPFRDPAMAEPWRELARHALGLPNANLRSYRNRFVTGSGGRNHRTWLDMVDAGFAERRDGGSLPFGGNDLFWLTPAGARSSLNIGESLCTEDFPEDRGHD